jgi:general secretion pathway protein D
VEFNEGALEELGFDWTVYGSGSVLGMEMQEGTYFQKSSGYTEEIDIADDSGALGGTLYTSPVTGQQLITEPEDRPGQNVFGAAQRDNTDAFGVIGSGLASTFGGAPSAMVFGNGDVDLRIAALEQQGTADVLSAPRVTAKSGTEATIRVAETHRYPQDYDVTTGQRTSPVVRPQDWEDFDMGVQLRVTPVVDAESSTIALELYPEILKFKGYEDYLVGYNAYDAGGNNSSAPGGDGSPFLTRMPFFERRYVETQVTIADGHTVAMGGLVDERTETFRDQVPILGDIPFVGRLFRTEGSRNVKKNLIIFVKASQVDARGMTRADRELAQY